MKKTVATLATSAALAVGVLVPTAAYAAEPCTPGENGCVIEPPVVEPCVPGVSYPTGGVCVLPGGQEIPATDWNKLLGEATQAADAAREAARVAEQEVVAAKQAASAYRLQAEALAAKVVKMQKTLDRKTATIKRLRAKVRNLRQG